MAGFEHDAWLTGRMDGFDDNDEWSDIAPRLADREHNTRPHLHRALCKFCIDYPVFLTHDHVYTLQQL